MMKIQEQHTKKQDNEQKGITYCSSQNTGHDFIDKGQNQQGQRNLSVSQQILKIDKMNKSITNKKKKQEKLLIQNQSQQKKTYRLSVRQNSGYFENNTFKEVDPDVKLNKILKNTKFINKCIVCRKCFTPKELIEQHEQQNYIIKKFSQHYNEINVKTGLSCLMNQGGGVLIIQGEQSNKIYGILFNQQYWTQKIKQWTRQNFKFNQQIAEFSIDFPKFTIINPQIDQRQKTLIRIWIRPQRVTLYPTKLKSRSGQQHQFLYIAIGPHNYYQIKPQYIYSILQKLLTYNKFYLSYPKKCFHRIFQFSIDKFIQVNKQLRPILCQSPKIRYENNSLLIINSVNYEKVILKVLKQILSNNSMHYQISLPYQKLSNPTSKIYLISFYQSHKKIKQNLLSMDKQIFKQFSIQDISKKYSMVRIQNTKCCLQLTIQQQFYQYKVFCQHYQDWFGKEIKILSKKYNNNNVKIEIECQNVQQIVFIYIVLRHMNIEVKL